MLGLSILPSIGCNDAWIGQVARGIRTSYSLYELNPKNCWVKIMDVVNRLTFGTNSQNFIVVSKIKWLL